MAINPLGINQGTQNLVNFDLVGTVNTQVVNIGTISGTLPAITNLVGGTVTKLTQGSINVTAGTITAGTLTNLTSGTINAATAVITTLPNLPQGSINVTAGTVGGAAATAVALSGNPIPIGGVDAGGTVYGLLTDTTGKPQVVMTVGTISSLSNLPQGSINVTAGTITAGTLTNLISGTINSATAVVGTIPGVGVVTNLTSGSVRMTVGTLTTGSLSNVAMLNAGTVVTSSGTITNSGTTTGVGIVSMLSAGTVSMINAGTITSVGTVPGIGILTAGTISMINAGTITSVGTVPGVGVVTSLSGGTVRNDARTTQNVVSLGSIVSGTAAIAATVVGSAVIGAGTSMWINDLSIMNPYGSILCVVGFGTAQTGTNVLFRGVVGTQTAVGIEKPYPKAVNANMTNQDLVVSLSGAGTIDVNVSYFISA